MLFNEPFCKVLPKCLIYIEWLNTILDYIFSKNYKARHVHYPLTGLSVGLWNWHKRSG